MELTTSIQREEIKDIVKAELMKRGINVSIDVEEKEGRIRLSSSTFQTIPVFFEEIRIAEFGSWIEKKEKYIEVTFCVNARYKYFNGGTNGVALFTLVFNCFGEQARLINCI